ncbi:MAG TPA: hypothetical protein VK589_06120 [Chryseolinea sp.]|nr:hypothetical protein [Chryseolinea sp.]
MYILDDCDHAGIWQVDFEVARIRIGEKVDYKTAVRLFGDRVQVIDDSKWWMPDFVNFQYGELSEKNRLHISVLAILSKYKVGPYKPLPRGQGTIQGQGQGQEKGQGKSKQEIFKEMFAEEVYITDLSIAHKGKDVKQAFEECYIHHSNAPNPPKELGEWKQKLNTWLSNTKLNGNRNTNKTGARRSDAVIETGRDFGEL